MDVRCHYRMGSTTHNTLLYCHPSMHQRPIDCVLHDFGDSSTRTWPRYLPGCNIIVYAAVFILRAVCADFPLLSRRKIRRPLYSERILGLIYLAGLVLVNVVVQFTSTFLISDTTNWPVPGSEEKRSIPFAVEMDGIDSRYGLYPAPSQFSFFAEGTRSASAFKVMDDNGFRDWRDSGSYVRALIPLFKFERPSLVKYRGPALAMDSHVLCIAQGLEQLEATLKYEYFDPLDRKKKT